MKNKGFHGRPLLLRFFDSQAECSLRLLFFESMMAHPSYTKKVLHCRARTSARETKSFGTKFPIEVNLHKIFPLGLRIFRSTNSFVSGSAKPDLPNTETLSFPNLGSQDRDFPFLSNQHIDDYVKDLLRLNTIFLLLGTRCSTCDPQSDGAEWAPNMSRISVAGYFRTDPNSPATQRYVENRTSLEFLPETHSLGSILNAES
jgi:hypothetical protein